MNAAEELRRLREKTCKKPTDNCNYQSAGGKESLRLSASILSENGEIDKWQNLY